MTQRYARDDSYGKPPNWSGLYREHSPEQTDPCSRHVAMIAQQLRDPKHPVRRAMIDAGFEPDHWASAMEVTVESLWQGRKSLVYEVLPSRNGKHRGRWVPRPPDPIDEHPQAGVG